MLKSILTGDTNRLDAEDLITPTTDDTLLLSDRFQRDVDYWREQIKTNGKDFLSWLNLGDAILRQEDPSLYPIVLACYEKTIHLNPSNPEAYIRTGSILIRLGRQDDAMAAVQKALNLDQGLVSARFKLMELQFPILYEREEDILASRSGYTNHLYQLCKGIDLKDQGAIKKAARAIGIYPFYLAYQGYNDCLLQQAYGDLVSRIQAARYPQWSKPLAMPQHKDGEPLRIGIVSGFFNHHSNWKMRIHGWLKAMDRHRFSLYGYFTGQRDDECTEFARRSLHEGV